MTNNTHEKISRPSMKVYDFHRKYLQTLIFGVILTGLSAGLMAAPSYDSTYTSIKPDDCTFSRHVGNIEIGYIAGSEQRCPSFRKIGVTTHEEDLRQSITLHMKGVDYSLDFWTHVTPHFSILGNLIEWRHEKGKPDQLAGMIVRLNASEHDGPDNPEKITSYLVVNKVTPQAVCVVGKIAPQVRENQNVKARAMAEQAARLPCL